GAIDPEAGYLHRSTAALLGVAVLTAGRKRTARDPNHAGVRRTREAFGDAAETRAALARSEQRRALARRTGHGSKCQDDACAGERKRCCSNSPAPGHCEPMVQGCKPVG